MKPAGVLALTVALFANDAAASYLSNRARWNSLNSTQKEAYAMGAADGLLTYTKGNKVSEAVARGFDECFSTNELNSADLAAIIDRGYAENVSAWGDPPRVLLANQLSSLCRRHINKARRELGLPPLETN